MALEDLMKEEDIEKFGVKKEELRPVPLIKVEGYGDVPAAEEVKKLKVKSQLEREKLEKATQNVYSAEYKYGRMRDDIVLLANEKYKKVVEGLRGLSVPEARERIKESMLRFGDALIMYEIMNGPVYCRCGNEIVVKVLENQWFLDYGDERWKELARRALSRMRIVPEEMRSAFERTIEWLKLRAMARTRGLGTPLPWDRSWVIESLSDSTIYMAFYTVSHLIKEYKVSPESLTPEVWDFILLGKGDGEELSRRLGIPEEFLKRAREEFRYWYPLDSRHSGKDLVENHLTFMIFHHAALFPEELWPRQIVVNGFVLYEGKKMSKSLRNIVPLSRAIEEYGPDGVRATLIYGAELGQDLDFYPSLAQRLSRELESLIELAELVRGLKAVREPKERMNRWLLSRIGTHIEEITEDMDRLRFRAALHKVLFELKEDLEWWLERKGFEAVGDVIKNGDDEAKGVLRVYVDVVARLLQPFVPFTAEEMWEAMGNEGFVSLARWPDPNDLIRDERVELEEEYVKMVIEDIGEIKKLVPGVTKILIVPAKEDEYELLMTAIDVVEKRKSTSALFKEAIRRFGEREGPRKAQQLFKFVTSLSPRVRELVKSVGSIDERRVIEENLEFIRRRSNIDFLEVKGVGEIDVKGKVPVPLRPAIVAQ
jgi:leucyl-tRNA synthetase